ncbi:hypothetical protein HK096_003424 [Nowakowskiella sp. JEL0078]|nr:hypothetical protein HK096_003424 [Nowakowskiella sp. JEL0078]
MDEDSIDNYIISQSDLYADFVIRDFAAQCVIRKGTWMTLANIVQIVFFMGFILIQILCLCLPAWVTGCDIRTYLAPLLLNAQVVVVWLINWLKVRAMKNIWFINYARNPWIKYSTAIICIMAISTQFQYLFRYSKIDPDILGRCKQTNNNISEYFHIGGDNILFIRLLLSGFFVAGTVQKASEFVDGNSESKNMILALMEADSRATFIDTTALAIKFSARVVGLPSNQMRFIYHFMDFAKVVGSHWFVVEVSNMGASSSANTNTTNKPGYSIKDSYT